MTTEMQPVPEAVVATPRRILPPGVARANAAATRLERRMALIMILTPLLGLIVAIALLWERAIGVTELLLLVGMYVLGMFGITIGFHRLASHRSFQTYAPIRALFAILGSTAAQGPVLYWAAIHRRHHQYSDHEGDPHSPNLHGDGLRGILKGFWHAHTGWMFVHEITDWGRWIPDLLRDRTLFRVNRFYFVWLFLGLAVPAVLGGWISGTWMGALLGLLWGGLVRLFLLHHCTWAINSVTHIWGTRPYKSRDYSRNNALVAIVTFGEGWHNNHHAFPSSAFHGLEWWQYDPSAVVLRLLRLFRLAWDLKRPSDETRREALRLPGQEADAQP
ncbi:MAG TPA: acyl-CoA desaturase [Gemmataceae bacterium]|jgi:stearoyl-CoA desaturase (delta-9 desaturase)